MLNLLWDLWPSEGWKILKRDLDLVQPDAGQINIALR
jgi:hypothetical protein